MDLLRFYHHIIRSGLSNDREEVHDISQLEFRDSVFVLCTDGMKYIGSVVRKNTDYMMINRISPFYSHEYMVRRNTIIEASHIKTIEYQSRFMDISHPYYDYLSVGDALRVETLTHCFEGVVSVVGPTFFSLGSFYSLNKETGYSIFVSKRVDFSLEYDLLVSHIYYKPGSYMPETQSTSHISYEEDLNLLTPLSDPLIPTTPILPENHTRIYDAPNWYAPPYSSDQFGYSIQCFSSFEFMSERFTILNLNIYHHTSTHVSYVTNNSSELSEILNNTSTIDFDTLQSAFSSGLSDLFFENTMYTVYFQDGEIITGTCQNIDDNGLIHFDHVTTYASSRNRSNNSTVRPSERMFNTYTFNICSCIKFFPTFAYLQNNEPFLNPSD